MALLDCGTFESALNGICSAYQAPSGELISFLQNIDMDEVYENCSPLGEDALIQAFESRFGTVRENIKNTCWFHLTRVLPGTTFSEGILPLNLVLDQVWDMILSIPRDPAIFANLCHLRTIGASPESNYSIKIKSPVNFGRFAMLVREAAFHSESMWNHDYLRTPEIIQDMCSAYEVKFGGNIEKELLAPLVPCIVKFESVEDDGPSVLAPALRYCWCKVHRRDLCMESNTCYDGNGIPVPPSAIRKVEFLNDAAFPQKVRTR